MSYIASNLGFYSYVVACRIFEGRVETQIIQFFRFFVVTQKYDQLKSEMPFDFRVFDNHIKER